MRKYWLSLSAAMGMLALSATAASAETSPFGSWARGDGIAKVVIRPCGGALCAINIWIKPGVTDEKVGQKLVLNVKREAAAHWVGTAFDPQRNLTFDVSFDVASQQMKMVGCALGGMLCKTVEWTRIAGE